MTISTTMIKLLLLFAMIQPAFTEEASEEKYLLGDLGVRIDLPNNMKMTRWSDWDFKAETKDKSVMLSSWSDGVQVTPTVKNSQLWTQQLIKHTETSGGEAPSLVRSDTKDGIGFAEVSFQYKKTKMTLQGAVIPIEGSNLYLANISTSKNNKRARQSLKDLVRRLDIRAKPRKDLSFGATLEAAGISTTLPEGWRPLLDKEQAFVAPTIDKLGQPVSKDCFVAIHPESGNVNPDIALTCQGGAWLGVVDSYSFTDIEAELRKKLFGQVKTAPAKMVELNDRVGFLYTPEAAGVSLAVAAVPYDQGVARTWIFGAKENAEFHSRSASQMMQATTYSGSHPASLGDRISYLMYRPIYLAGVAILFLAILGGLGLLLFKAFGSQKSKYQEF